MPIIWVYGVQFRCLQCWVINIMDNWRKEVLGTYTKIQMYSFYNEAHTLKGVSGGGGTVLKYFETYL